MKCQPQSTPRPVATAPCAAAAAEPCLRPRAATMVSAATTPAPELMSWSSVVSPGTVPATPSESEGQATTTLSQTPWGCGVAPVPSCLIEPCSVGYELGGLGCAGRGKRTTGEIRANSEA
jgi:hypothetical protein